MSKSLCFHKTNRDPQADCEFEFDNDANLVGGGRIPATPQAARHDSTSSPSKPKTTNAGIIAPKKLEKQIKKAAKQVVKMVVDRVLGTCFFFLREFHIKFINLIIRVFVSIDN